MEGVALARHRRPLSNALFGIRARVVAGNMPASRARDMASGLLIGAEFAAAGEECGDIVLVGAAPLCERYAKAAALFGIASCWRDPQALYCAALTQFLKARNEHASRSV